MPVFLGLIAVIVPFLVTVPTERNRIDQVGYLDDRCAVGCGVLQSVVESCFESQSIGDDHLGCNHLGDLGR